MKKLHLFLLTKTLDSKIYMIVGQWIFRGGETMELPQCPEPNRVNGLSIQATLIILWHNEAHLLEAFRDTY